MPATRARSQHKGKRPRASSAGDAEHLEKRARSGGGSPVRDSPNDNPNDIVYLRDRTRLSWQSKGKWREKTPRRPMMMSLTQAASDLLAPSTSKQGAATNAMLAAEDTSIIDISSILEDQPSQSAIDPQETPTHQKELELQAEIDKLRNELKQKDQVISRHENTIEVVQNSMHCPICLDPLWKPFVVVPCGHIACQGCLVNWFTSPPPDPNGDPPEPLPPHRQKQKRKTCPHCRGVVRSRPVEVYGLGTVVATLVGQQGPASPSKSEAADPWADMFPPPRNDPLRDEEDGGILRCPECFHELWGGECTRCGRVFSEGGSGDSAFGSDDGSISIYGDDLGSVFGGGGGSLFGGSIYGDSDDGSGDSVYGDEPPLAYIHRGRVYDSYDEDEDEDDSFIDDSELPPPPAAYFHHYVPSDSDEDEEEEEDNTYHSARGDGYRSPVPTVIRVSESGSEDDDDSDDEEEDDFLPPRGRRGRSAETSSNAAPETAEEADDEEEEDDGEDAPSTVDPNATIDLVSDDDDDEPPIRAAGRRSAAARWGWSPADGEPERGRSLSRRRIVSPRAESENGSEYFSD